MFSPSRSWMNALTAAGVTDPIALRLHVHESGIAEIRCKLRDPVGTIASRLHRADVVGLDERHGAIDLIGRHALVEQAVNFRCDLSFEQFWRDSWPRGDVDNEQVRTDREIEGERLGVRRNLLFADERAVEATSPAHAEHGGAPAAAWMHRWDPEVGDRTRQS